MIALPVTSVIAALAALLLLVLSHLAGAARLKSRISLGTGDDGELLKRVRAQANFTEYTPIALILIALAEVGGAAAFQLWAMGAMLVIGRSLHAYGLIRTVGRARGAGMILTFLTLLWGSGLLLVLQF